MMPQIIPLQEVKKAQRTDTKKKKIAKVSTICTAKARSYNNRTIEPIL